jgi:hypothetical protein
MKRSLLHILWVTAALLVLLPLAAQAPTGSVAGRVVDEKGVPIADARVTVTSSHLQGPRKTMADKDGEFLISSLPPASDYKVTAVAPGFNKVVQSGLRVGLGMTTTTQFVLSSGGEQVEVRAQPKLLDLKDTKISTILTQQEMESIPVGREIQKAFYLAPNVVDSGMSSPPNPGMAGSSATENMYFMDGLNLTDPVGGVLAVNFNYNFAQEISIYTGGLDAEYGASTGGMVNILTKSGSNHLHGEVFGYYTDQSLAANQESTALSPNRPQPFHNYDYGFDLGGPIIRDRLWYFIGFNPTLYTQHYEGTSNLTNVYDSSVHLYLPYSYDDLQKNWIGLAKLNFRINDAHNLELTFFSNPAHEWLNEGAGNQPNSNPVVPTVDPRARMTRRYLHGYDASLKWYASWGPNLYQETQIGKVHQVAQILPWEEAGYGRPQIISYDWSPNLSIGSGTGIMYWDNRDMFQLQTKVTWMVHRHQIKFGGQLENTRWDSYNGYTGGAQYAVQGQFPSTPMFSANLQDYAFVFKSTLQNPYSLEHGRYIAAFVQDNWSVTDHAALSYGVRWERNELLPNEGPNASLDSWSPRVGFTWDFAHNGRSKTYLYYGRYYQRVPIAASFTMDPGHERYYTVTAYGFPYSSYTFGATPTAMLPGTKNQYNDEYMAGAEYELFPDFTIGLKIQYRSLGRVLEDVGYLDNQGNIAFYLMNPGTGQWPAVMDRWAAVLPDYERFAHPIRHYLAYTFTAQKRFSHHWYLNASYTLSYLKGNYSGGSGGYSVDALSPDISTAYDFPERIYNQNRYGYLPQDIRSYVKLQGFYKFDGGLSLGADFIYHTGRPINKLYQYPLNGPGYGTLFAAHRGTDRLPSLWRLDLHAQYDFRVKTSTLSLFADLFNVANRQVAVAAYQNYYVTPTSLADVFSGNLQRDPYWGSATMLQQPRFLRLGVKWSF